MNQITAAEAIDILGGTTAVARLLDIKPPSVHEWRAKGAIPESRLLQLAPALEVASGGKWSRWTLFPATWHRIWPELIGREGAPSVPQPAEKVA